MPGCKVGDLARFIAPSANEGKQCLIKEFWAPGEWVIEVLQPTHANLRENYLGLLMGTGVCEDWLLEPIRPGDLEGEHPGDKLVEPLKEPAECSGSLVSS